MIKHLITGALFALGGAGVVLVGYLDGNSLAFTHPVGVLSAVPATPSTPPIVPIDLDAERHPIVLAEVRITASRRSTPPRAAVMPARFDPCSEWRDVGVLVVDSAGVASGVRSVRALCAQPDGDL
jgi:hypothetical protein